jgi:hypothetical protein
MCYETRSRSAADTNPTNEEWEKVKHEFHAGWERAQVHFNEFGAKFQAKMKEHASADHDNPRMLQLSLPNGRQFSFNIGHVILAGLLLWWLPFNLVILGVVLWLAYQVGSANGEKPKRKSSALAKRKADEDEGEFDVFHV